LSNTKATAKITKTSPVVTYRQAGFIKREFLTMCYCQPRTVLLLDGGRTFRCAYCHRVREHPYFIYDYARDGHAYCGECGLWMKIENYTPFQTEAESKAASEGENGVRKN
jgi:hypothetical protein